MQNSDYIAIAAAVVAFLAMVVTFWQGWLMRRHNQLSVRPLLAWCIDRRNTPQGAEISFVVRNRGLGPAIVKDRYFTVKSERFQHLGPSHDEVPSLIQKLLGQTLKYHLGKCGLPGVGSAIPPNEEVIIAHLSFPGLSGDTLTSVMDEVGEVDFFVEYESLYRQKAMMGSNGRGGFPIPSKSAPGN